MLAHPDPVRLVLLSMKGTGWELLHRATDPGRGTRFVPESLMVFAHPDDEVIALGGRLRRFRRFHLVHVTDGAPRDERDSRLHGFSSWRAYRDARAREFSGMLEVAGIANAHCEKFDIPDQEAALHLELLTKKIEALLEGTLPDVLFTHPYEGGHPDHDACAFAVTQAVNRRAAKGKQVPLIAECAFYHAGREGIETGCFLNHAGLKALTYALSPKEQHDKQKLLDCFPTQKDTLRYFRTDTESFRIAPRYDFTQPPHPGVLFYEHFRWGISAKELCRSAAEAQDRLQMEAL